MIRINLLPKVGKKKAKPSIALASSKEMFIKLGLPTAIAILLVTGLFIYMEITKTKLKEDIENNKKIFAQLQKKIEEVKKFEEMNKEIETKTKLIENLKSRQNDPVAILSSLAKNLSEGLWLSEVSFGMQDKPQVGQQPVKEAKKEWERKIVVKGFGFSNLNIVAFVEALKKVPEFREVKLLETQQTKYENFPVYKFILEFNLKE